jgi:hypothetical protein
MLVNVNAHPGSRPSAVGQLGELSRARVILSEFKYNKGTEIFGETEPADYIYQVVDGAVRSHKLLSDGRRQIGAFHLVGDILAQMVRFIDLPRRRSSTRPAIDKKSLDVAEATPRSRRPPEHDDNNPQHAEDHCRFDARVVDTPRLCSRWTPPERRRCHAFR